ncbi:MAG: DegT/DnrJ/EryC1/StrS family aminotransferase [Candidatus Nanopelagicaceae bacterium]
MVEYKWSLMKDNMTLMDRVRMAKFCMTSDRFTNGLKVREFESSWSEWIGSKYSLYVSSGSTANYLLIAAIKEVYGLKTGDKVVVPACTWVTNINPVFQLGFQPIFCDVNVNTFTYCEKDLKFIAEQHPDIKMVFTTHLMGFPAPVERYKDIFPNALFIDDVCESHGCLNSDGSKVGSDSLGATFSFYFGHHMSTIEGGMISTNDHRIYDMMRLKRSHGLARESDNKEVYYDTYPNIDKQFLFVTDGYNFRNHELCAVLGKSQLKRLNKMIERRNENYKKFVKVLSEHSSKVYVPIASEKISSFCLPLVFKHKDNMIKFKKLCLENNVEYRPIISGNLLEQPYLKNYKITTSKTNLDVDIIHQNGLYLGNNQFVGNNEIALLNNLLQKI